MGDLTDDEVIDRLTAFRQYVHDGKRVPHKPLLVLLALGQLERTGSSAVRWTTAEQRLADLIAEFGPPSRTAGPQAAAYPFTRLRNDGVWTLDHDVPDDGVRSLRETDAVGRLAPALEAALREKPALVAEAARRLVDAQFPMTIAPDVLDAVGLDPDVTFGPLPPVADLGEQRRRSTAWRHAILAAWDHQCAFCGYDGQLAGSAVGIEAAHVRWFNLGGPDDPDNGLALCSLHHKLLDRGVLGLDTGYRVQVSTAFSARTDAGRQVYALHQRELRARPGTTMPRLEFVHWHTTQVFKARALTA